jgi:replication factor C subunit 3/5
MLTWTEKYRPTELENIIIEPNTKQLIDNMIHKRLFPNLLFYGPPGTGKTTTIMCIIKRYQDTYNFQNNVIHLNASDDRGIEVIRNQLYSFVNSKGLYNNELKFVILDEVDSMTKQAQQSLLNLITKPNVRFCLICNYFSKLIPTLRDYLLMIPFYINKKEINNYINNILTNENMELNEDIIENIKYNYYPDMRSIVNCLQIYNSYPYDIIKKDMIINNCIHYDKNIIKEYIKTNSLKDYLIKLFLEMFNYNVDTTLIMMMKSLILIKQDFNYFDEKLMPYFISLQNN